MGEELESVKQGVPKDDAQNEAGTRFQQDLEASILLGFHLKEISLSVLFLFLFFLKVFYSYFIYLFLYFWLCWVFSSCEGFL